MNVHFNPLMGVLIFLGIILTGFASSKPAYAETYITKTFHIEIQQHCEEGILSCEDVSYVGINLQTGDKINLKGRTVHTKCKDGVSPCRFLGYAFQNGSYTYRIMDEYLTVLKSGKEIFREKVKAISY